MRRMWPAVPMAQNKEQGNNESVFLPQSKAKQVKALRLDGVDGRVGGIKGFGMTLNGYFYSWKGSWHEGQEHPKEGRDVTSTTEHRQRTPLPPCLSPTPTNTQVRR